MSGRAVERVAETGLFVAASSGMLLLVAVVAVVLGRGVIAFADPAGLAVASIVRPALATALVSATAAALCLPVALGAAIWTTHFARHRWRRTARDAASALEAIPTVVFGFVGLAIVAPLTAVAFDVSDGRIALTAALVLAFMALPTVIIHVEGALARVPAEQLEAARALGASRMQAVLHVALPAAWPGVLAGLAAGVARALGDTMIVLLVAGAAVGVGGLLSPVEPLSAAIVRRWGEPQTVDVLCAALLLASLGLTIAVERRRHR